MARTVNARFRYSQDIEAVYRHMTDPAAIRARSEAAGELNVQVTRTGDTLTNLRQIELQLPAFLKGLYTPTQTVLDVKVWNPEKKTATLTVDVRYAPTQVGGKVSLEPAEGGCDYVVEMSLACKVPLLGGMIEGFMVTATESALKAEYEFHRKMLEQGAPSAS